MKTVWRLKSLQLRPSSSSSSSNRSQEEDQKIDWEGDAVMHMNFPALADEYKFCSSAKGSIGPELRQTRG